MSITTTTILNPLPNPNTLSKLPKPTIQLPLKLHTPQLSFLSKLSSLPSTANGATAATALILPFFLNPEDALAVGGEFGILEGRTFALIHPAVMGGLFFYTLYAGYLGWQWRRVRTIQDEVNELKKQIKPPVPAAVAAGSESVSSPPPPPVSPVEAQIQQLTEEIGSVQPNRNKLIGRFNFIGN